MGQHSHLSSCDVHCEASQGIDPPNRSSVSQPAAKGSGLGMAATMTGEHSKGTMAAILNGEIETLIVSLVAGEPRYGIGGMNKRNATDWVAFLYGIHK